MSHYPKFKYHSSEQPKIVCSAEEEKSLGSEWADSPAEFGVETEPGLFPDEQILAKKKKFEDPKKVESKKGSKE